MMHKKTFELFGLLLAVMMLFTACGKKDAGMQPGGDAAATGDAKYTIGYSNMDSNNPHFVSWGDGLRSALEPLGHTLVEIDAQNDGSKQISDVEDMIAQQCDVIMIAPVDSKGIKTALLACQQANIPAFILDIPAEDTDLVTCTIATDNFSAGKLLADKLVDETSGKATVAVIDLSVSEAVRKRMDGFFSVVDQKPDIKVVIREDCLPTVEDSLPLVENYLQSNPEITDIFCYNDLTAQGAYNACVGAGRADIRVYGIDGSADGIRLTNDGKIVGTSAQFPVKMGAIAGETACKLLTGKKIEKEILIESLFIDKALDPDYM